MVHKIITNILSWFNISNIVFILLSLHMNVLPEMYISYGLEDQIPNSYNILAKFKWILIALLVIIVLFLIWYDLYFNKTRREEKASFFKRVSIDNYFVMGSILLLTHFIFLIVLLKPIMEVYMESFLIEANGI